MKRIEAILMNKDQDISQLEDRVLRLEHLLDNKLEGFDGDALNKWRKYIESKITALYLLVETPDTNTNTSREEDARAARSNNWACLSCDKKLENFRGKVGHHLKSGNLKGKTIDVDVLGGGMMYRSKSRYEMPTLKK